MGGVEGGKKLYKYKYIYNKLKQKNFQIKLINYFLFIF